MVFIVIYLLMSGASSSKNLTLMGSMTLSYGNYTSLAKEREVDSLFPPWTTSAGVEYVTEIKWKNLIAKLEFNGCSRRPLNAVEGIGDSLYTTSFDFLSSYIGLLLNVPKTKIYVKPMIGYGWTREFMELETRNDKILQKQSYSKKGWSYGCNMETKLIELSWWRPLAFLNGCCFGGHQISEEKENAEKVFAIDNKVPVYLSIDYFSAISNQTKFMEKFSIRIITQESPCNFLIGTSLYLKNGKFKWWEKVFVGLGLTRDF